MKQWVSLFVLVCIMSVSVGCGLFNTSKSNETIIIQAAASLKGALTEVSDNYKKQHNLKDDQISINFAGSGTLRQQIEQGAPASLFISANEKNMTLLEEKGLMADVKPLIMNELVLIVPNGRTPISFDQLPTVNRVILGNPETVPAGNYGKQVLTNLGLWEQVEPHIVYAKDVKAVTASISQGAGDAGVVYKTDAIAADGAVTVAALVPTNFHDPVIYPVGIIKKYDTQLAREFYAYIMSPEGQQIFEKYGFTGVSVK